MPFPSGPVDLAQLSLSSALGGASSSESAPLAQVQFPLEDRMKRLLWVLWVPIFLAGVAVSQNIYTIKQDQDQYYKYLRENSPTFFDMEGTGFNDYNLWLDTQLPLTSVHGGDLPQSQQVITDYLRSLQASGTGSKNQATGNDWVELGPYGSTPAGWRGRLDFVSFGPQSPNLILTGSAVGGLYYSDDGGVSWKKGGMDDSTDDAGQPRLGLTSASHCVVHPTNSDVWFCATGDNAAFPDGGAHDIIWNQSFGVYCTTNRGANWNFVGLNIGSWGWEIHKLLFKPNDPTVLYAATSGGVYQATNTVCKPAELSWNLLSFAPINSSQDIFDIEFQPGSSTHLYASGKIQDLSGLGVIMESLNAGGTWSPLTGTTFLTAKAMRTSMAVTPANPDLLYASVINCAYIVNNSCVYQGNLYRFNVSVASWTDKGPTIATWPSHAGALAVSPINPGLLYIGHVWPVERCVNADQGGYCAWQGVGSGHADVASIKFAPDGTSIWQATDGGIFQTTPSNTPWIDRNTGLGVATPLGMATAATDPDIILLGLYDNGAQLSLNSGATWDHDSIFCCSCCDGLGTMIDYLNPQNMYASTQNGFMYRSADEGKDGFPNGAYPPTSADWHTFSVLNSQDPAVFYAASHPEVWKTSNQGMSGTWTQISSFGLGLIWRLYTAPSNPDYLYAWALDFSSSPWQANLFKTTGANSPTPVWTAITRPGVPCTPGGSLPAFPGGFTVDPTDPDTFMFSYPGYCAAAPQRVYECTCTATCSCTDLDVNLKLPKVSIDSLTAEKGSGGYLFAGTPAGVYFKTHTTDWTRYGNKLPHTSVQFLDINCASNKLRAGTFGRGVWEIPLTCPQ
jgi:hypothetical protein